MKHYTLLLLILLALPLHAENGCWYLPEKTSQKTASHQQFDPDGLYAAHPSLPFGSIVRVINEETGKMVDVTVNDRPAGLVSHDIYLTPEAAKRVGLYERGNMDVKIIPLYTPTSKPEETNGSGWYRLELKEFQNLDDLLIPYELLVHSNLKPAVTRQESGYTLSVRWIPAYKAENIKTKIINLGFPEENLISCEEENPYH